MSVGDAATTLPITTVPMSELVDSIEVARAAGRHSDAQAFCRVAIRQAPENASLHLWLGWIAIDLKAYSEAISAAREAASLPDHDDIGIARLLVYAAGMSGDWVVAKQALAELSRSDESAAKTIAAEAAPAFLAYLNDVRGGNAFQEVVDSFEHVPAILGSVAPDIMREIRVAASISYLALGKAETAIAIFGQSMAATPSTPQPSLASRPLLVTSLMPSRLDVQKAAVASWQRLGFDVASLNASDEIGYLHSEFDGVTFHVAERDARERLGRPLVYVDDMLAILAKETGKVVGIINSDIVFASDATDSIAEAISLASEAFLFGHRLDVERLGEASSLGGELLLFGYDWFLFGAGDAAALAGGGFVFGAPWWDIWLPLRAKLAGADIVNVRRSIALHEKHAICWRQSDLEGMGRTLATALFTDAHLKTPASRFQRRLRELAGFLHNMPPEVFSAGENLDWLASLLRGLIQIEATPFGAVRDPVDKHFWDSRGQI